MMFIPITVCYREIKIYTVEKRMFEIVYSKKYGVYIKFSNSHRKVLKHTI